MKLKIEVRPGPPSMFNAEADNYVVAIHESFEKGERMLGGPMTEANAIGMIEAIRTEGLPENVVEEFGEPELPRRPKLPTRVVPPKPTIDQSVFVPVVYIGAAVIFVLIVSHFGIQC